MQKGHSLVETVLVLAVTSVLLGSAVWNFRDARERQYMDSALHLLAGDLRMVQQYAINQGLDSSAKIYSILFIVDDAGDSGYLIVDGAHVVKRIHFSGHIQYIGHPDDIRFSPISGAPNKGQTIYISSSLIKDVRKVVLEGAVGRVRIE